MKSSPDNRRKDPLPLHFAETTQHKMYAFQRVPGAAIHTRAHLHAQVCGIGTDVRDDKSTSHLVKDTNDGQ